MKDIVIFNKSYDGESLYDLDRDVAEALDGNYNEVIDKVPQDKWGLHKGSFIVSIIWTDKEVGDE
jgi:hypothetical protein